jgi:ABC-type Na+ transport system ATPase subunit NatA
MLLLKTVGLTKYYGKKLAIENISFSVSEGEIVGFVGPNGARKTTTIRKMGVQKEPEALNNMVCFHRWYSIHVFFPLSKFRWGII